MIGNEISKENSFLKNSNTKDSLFKFNENNKYSIIEKNILSCKDKHNERFRDPNKLLDLEL